jgi:threonine dehydratase
MSAARRSTTPIGLAEVEAAAKRIAGRVHRTPVFHSRLLDAELGCEVLAKGEHLQRVGSFKARGAFNALLSLNPVTRARGVIAVSSGNHAQAVALAASETGASAVVVMPSDSNPAKVAATEAYGAEVITEGVTPASREAVVLRLAAERGLHLVHPFDDLDVMAGQGTAALELLEEIGEPDVVLVPVGGGGLLSGTAVAVKGRSPGTRVVGVEPEVAADARDSLAAGHRVSLPAPPETAADGVRSMMVGERPFEVIRRMVDEIVTVTEDELLDTLALAWSRTKQLIEPTSALPLAALRTGAVRAGRAGVILSGGNVDATALTASLRKKEGIDAAVADKGTVEARPTPTPRGEITRG